MKERKDKISPRWTNESSLILLYSVIFIFKGIPKDIRDEIGNMKGHSTLGVTQRSFSCLVYILFSLYKGNLVEQRKILLNIRVFI